MLQTSAAKSGTIASGKGADERMKEVVRLLSAGPLFAGISQAEIGQLLCCAGAQMRELPAGAPLLVEGEESPWVYLLMQGNAAVENCFAGGGCSRLYTAGPGELLGQPGGGPSPVSVHAQTACQVLVLPADFFHRICGRACDFHRRLAANLLAVQSRQIWRLSKKLRLLAAGRLDQRLAMLLLDRMSADGTASLESREQLAAYLGAARPSLSRTLMQMQRDGLIAVEGRAVRVLDRPALEQLCL